MKTISILAEALWGVSLPVDYVRPLISLYAQAMVELLGRLGRLGALSNIDERFA